ncbi:MAG: FecR family protein [Spirochaetes bacterium]|nr:FecR family protein [Spirochaetota bacterium]
MKKFIFTAIFVTLLVSGAFCQNGVIKELTGEVELKKSGSNSFVQANAGDAVAANTIISTGFRSTAIIAVGSSVITVRPLTRLSLAEIQSAENTEKVNVNLQAGRVRVEVKPPAGTKTNLNVQSPSATASVRGTTFEMDTQNLNGVEGKVMLTGTSGAPVMVTGGNSSSSNIDGTVSNPVINAEQSVQVQQPVGSNNDSIKPKFAKGELIINIEYSQD